MELARLSCNVPELAAVVTGMFQLNPESEVVGVPTVAPDAAVPLNEKFAAVTL